MDLAYTIALGKRRFFWAARLAAASLRRFGGFDGEVVLFTDRGGRAPDGVRVEVVRDPEILREPKWLKVRVRDLIDLGGYERVVFLDGDIVVRSSLQPFLDTAERTGRLVVTDDLGQPIGQGLSQRCLTPAERAEHGDTVPGINSGFFVGPGRELTGWLAAWEQMLRDHLDTPGEGFDQAGLNACALRGLIPTERIDGQMWFPKRDPERQRCADAAPLVHFHGIGRHLNRYFRMRRFYRSLGRD